MTADRLLIPMSLTAAVRAAAQPQSHDRGMPDVLDAMLIEFPETRENVERLTAMLDFLKPAIEGEELPYEIYRDRIFFPLVSLLGDGWDKGRQYKRTLDLSRCYPKHSDREFSKLWNSAKPTGRRGTRGIGSLIAFCHERGYKPAIDLSVDPELSDAADDDRPLKFPFEHGSAFATLKPIEWCIKNVLPQYGFGLLIGQSGGGKSSIMVDMIGSVLRGVTWRNRRTRQGRVMIIAAEGVDGMRRRLGAYAKVNGVDMADLPIAVISIPPNLLTDDHRELVRSVNAFGGADVIVIDTLAAVTPGGNENSSESMGKAIDSIGRIQRATKSMILVVHHLGKQVDKGARGWSGLHAAADAVMQVECNGDVRSLKVMKLKDGEAGAEMGFKLHPVELGEPDADGDIPTAAVVEHVYELPNRQPRKPTGRLQKIVFELIEQHGPLSVERAIDLAVPTLAFDPGSDDRDRRRERLRRAIDELTSSRTIYLIDGRLSIDWPDDGDDDGL